MQDTYRMDGNPRRKHLSRCVYVYVGGGVVYTQDLCVVVCYWRWEHHSSEGDKRRLERGHPYPQLPHNK